MTFHISALHCDPKRKKPKTCRSVTLPKQKLTDFQNSITGSLFCKFVLKSLFIPPCFKYTPLRNIFVLKLQATNVLQKSRPTEKSKFLPIFRPVVVFCSRTCLRLISDWLCGLQYWSVPLTRRIGYFCRPSHLAHITDDATLHYHSPVSATVHRRHGNG